MPRRGRGALVRSRLHCSARCAFEALGLLDVKCLEVAELGIGFEPVEGLRDAVERSLAEAFGLGEIDEVRAVDPTPG